jgi:hypothetical protein
MIQYLQKLAVVLAKKTPIFSPNVLAKLFLKSCCHHQTGLQHATAQRTIFRIENVVFAETFLN